MKIDVHLRKLEHIFIVVSKQISDAIKRINLV